MFSMDTIKNILDWQLVESRVWVAKSSCMNTHNVVNSQTGEGEMRFAVRSSQLPQL